MFSSQCAVFFALSINFQHVKGLMVESVDGSFVPWSFVKRDPGGPLPVRMKNNFDQAYLATVLMGTPAQPIPMAVSLSQNFISVATPPGGVADPSYYNATASTSYTPIDASANLTTISGGNTVGHFAGEICTLTSGSSGSDASFTYNAAVVFTDPNVTTDLFPSGARAVLGYGVNTPIGSPLNASMLPSFLGALGFTTGTAICGVELNHFDDPFPDGFLTMGADDPTAFTGNFTDVMVPPTTTISWSIPVDNITYMDSGTDRLNGVAGGLSSIDMYHNTIQVTNDVANQIYSATPGAQPISDTEWYIPCNSKFPITLTFAGVPFAIDERDTIIKHPNNICTGVIIGGAETIGKVGAPFMRNVYTHFAAAKSGNETQFSVGFAQKVRRQTAPTTSSTAPSGTPSTPSVSGARATILSSPMLGLMVVSIAVVIFL